MTPNEELHAKFFSEEAVLVQGMSDVDLDEHIHSLEEIAREAKARIMASTEEKRNRKAKAGNKAWRIEPNGPDPTVSDSLNKVNQRSARMSKLEKMRDKLAELGIPDSEIEQMVSKMVSQARKEPAALRDEAKLKKTLAEPTIITEETRLAQIAERKRLDEKDKQEEKAEKAEKEKLTPFTVENENRLAVAVLDSESETAKAQAKSDLVKSKAQSLFGPNIA